MHVVVVITEREEMLNLVDHFVAASQDWRKSLQLFNIILSEAVALFDCLDDILAERSGC